MNAEREFKLGGWVTEFGVTCVVCPKCAFTFDAAHENTDQSESVYSCPACGPGTQLDDLVKRLDHANELLVAASNEHENPTEHERLKAKAAGVRVAIGYCYEAIKLANRLMQEPSQDESLLAAPPKPAAASVPVPGTPTAQSATISGFPFAYGPWG